MEGWDAARSLDAIAGRYRSRWGNSALDVWLLPGGRYSRAGAGNFNYLRDCGHVALVRGELQFLPVPQGDRGVEELRERRLVPVPWGARRYLIEPDAMASFCDAVNQGREPRQSSAGLFLLRDGDWRIGTKGLPDVPLEWRARLLGAPLAGAVVECVGEHRARINVGSKDGVYDELTFEVSTENPTGHSRFRAVVVSLATDSCVVEDELADLDPAVRASSHYPSFAVGHRVSSQLGAP
jgi:hypothetical protein